MAVEHPPSDGCLPASHGWMRLADYRPTGYSPGRGLAVRALWYLISNLLFESGWLPSSAAKRWLLRRFGASVGQGVVIKPHVRIKFPWRIRIGDHSWIGEDVRIDNLAEVRIGRNCCVSQGAFLCTGSHDHRRETFDLRVGAIEIADEAWIAARAIILPGTMIPTGVVVAAGSVVPGSLSLPEAVIIGGVPAQVLGTRAISSNPDYNVIANDGRRFAWSDA